MDLRWYQSEAADAVDAHLCGEADNPLVVIPTAGGKTIVFATLIRRWFSGEGRTPRVVILAHRKELLAQAADKIRAVWPGAPVGIWSASLKRRDMGYPITVAGIQSIYKRAFDFDPFDIAIVDEAHLIPTDGEGLYRRFLSDCLMANPAFRVVGFTATPYRISGGHIAQDGYILNRVCYEAPIGQLIADGFLCKLTSKSTETELDVSGVGTSKGDYIQKQLEAAVDTQDAVSKSVAELVRRGADRKSWLIFCAGVSHAHHVAEEIESHGIGCATITGKTPPTERDDILRRFDRGDLRAVTNIDCLTTGLDVTRIDLIAMLRPTKSTSLYVQMVGRGFRLHPNKTDCLVLDFGMNVRYHGPVDHVRIRRKGELGGEPPSKTCPECKEIVAASARECPCCGYLFPPPQKEHITKPDNVQILRGDEPWDMVVQSVSISKWSKAGKPPCLIVDYSDGFMESHREFIAIERTDYPGQLARRWWMRRFRDQPFPKTVDEAMANMFLGHQIQSMTEEITLKYEPGGKYPKIIAYKLKHDSKTAIAS